jgi:hypothetical protein
MQKEQFKWIRYLMKHEISSKKNDRSLIHCLTAQTFRSLVASATVSSLIGTWSCHNSVNSIGKVSSRNTDIFT